MNAARAERVAAGKVALTLHWEGERIRSIDLDWAGDAPPDPELSPDAARLQAALEGYAAGRPTQFPDMPLDLDRLPEFARRVLTLLRANFGHGRWTTYGGLAALAGRPGAARAVGRIMGANPFPLLIPCHRVLAARGALGGFSGCGLPMKEHLLRLEGVLR